MADTAVPTIGEIVTALGGTPTAETVVPALEELKEQLGEGGFEQYVNAWLDDHPEATTTVQDGAITAAKLASGLVEAISNADVSAMFE